MISFSFEEEIFLQINIGKLDESFIHKANKTFSNVREEYDPEDTQSKERYDFSLIKSSQLFVDAGGGPRRKRQPLSYQIRVWLLLLMKLLVYF